MSAEPRRHLPGPTLFLALGLLLLSPGRGRAESGASYKYVDYREDGDRIDVITQNALLEQDFGTATHIRLLGVIDAIAGATPNGQPAPAGSDQVVLTELDERREAWNIDASHQFSGVALTAGYAQSKESDYESAGWSLNSDFDFNEKNTHLLLGVAGTDDTIKVFYQPEWVKKRNTDLLLGVTQVIDPRTSIQVNVTWGRATGYLNDQYKLVQKHVEVAPGIFLPFTYSENRPDERTRGAAYVLLNRAYPGAKGALEASYRFYTDSFDITAHTLELSWLQRLGARVVLKPTLRLYRQSAAEFYHYNLDNTPIMPTGGAPQPAGPFYSSDYRLSKMSTINYGLKAVWAITDRWRLDANIERYEMRGLDDVTPDSAYAEATILTAGLAFTW